MKKRLSCAVQEQIIFKIMPQKSITTFFKPPQKRRLEESEDEKSTSKSSKVPNVQKITSSPDQSTLDRIKKLASENPALSPNIGFTWFLELEKEFTKDYFKELGKFLKTERSKVTVYPPENEVYSWTNSVDIYDVKVVILGQDPYILPKQAHGLAFSVRKGVAIPKSLINIYKELENDIQGFVSPTHGCLVGWASQGVLLLNTRLTVKAGASDSHKGKGWDIFTDAVIKWINQNLSHVVFILWGNGAKEKASLITKDKHLVLTAAHPSPLAASRGFFGCRHFSKANKYLKQYNKKEIDWKYLP